METPLACNNQSAWPDGATKVAELIAPQAGAVVSRVLLKRKGGNVTLFAFDVGQELSEHTAPFDALVQVLEGEAKITIAGNPIMVRAGEVLLLPAGKPHSVYAQMELRMLLTMVRE
ncbi:MAG: cupin domain-containing protein [Phycisphaerae bacterium]